MSKFGMVIMYSVSRSTTLILFLAVNVLGTAPKEAQQCSQRVKNDLYLFIEDQTLLRSYELIWLFPHPLP
jgi:hypothetical protein